MTTTKRELLICSTQERITDISIGCTALVRNRAVTRLAKDAYEVDTFGRCAGVSSETAAELLVDGERL